jgi:hypothetical protein
VLIITGLVLALASVPARSASPYGVLDHFDVCDPSSSDTYHNYVSLRSIAVDPAGYVYVSGNDGVIRAISRGGLPLGTVTTGPSRDWNAPVVGTGPAGAVYVGDQGGPTDPAQLAKYTLSGGNLNLAHTYVTNQGGYATTTGIVEIAGIAVSQNRGLFILDPTQGIVNLNEADGSFIGLTLLKGHGRPVAIGTMHPVAIVTAATSDLSASPNWTGYYAGDPLSYAGETNTSPGLVGVADGNDRTIWALDSAGLEHYKLSTLLATVPIPGGGIAIATSTDGSIWVARQDGILHVGPGGGVIPPDQYGHAPCGGPKISDSLPRQSIRATHQVEVRAQCADACSLIANATVTVPGSRTTYKLMAPRASYSANGSFDLRLALRPPGYRALVNALNHHRKATVALQMGSIDSGYVRAYLQTRIVIS